jgi:MFS family permease
MLRVISADLKLSLAQGASLVTATLIGAVIGGIVFGMISDRLGRVRVLRWTIVVFAVCTGLCALSSRRQRMKRLSMAAPYWNRSV